MSEQKLRELIAKLVEVRYVKAECYPQAPLEQYVIFIAGVPCLTGAANTPVEKYADMVRAGLEAALAASGPGQVETVTVSKKFFNKTCQWLATYKQVFLEQVELIKKWREESTHAPIRLARYGNQDDLEHCASELEASHAALAQPATAKQEDGNA